LSAVGGGWGVPFPLEHARKPAAAIVKPMKIADAVAQARMARILDAFAPVRAISSNVLRRLVLAPLALVVAFAWAEGCQSAPALKLCGEIPAGGCPIGRGGTCEDATCADLYDCVEGAWTEVVRCTGSRDGGLDARGDGAGDSGDAGSCTAIMFDHTGEKVDCMPDLQEPDCPAAAAEGCAEQACLTGCLDFFLCTANGWTDVAYCDDNGDLVVTQK